jgi:hypothetical protein
MTRFFLVLSGLAGFVLSAQNWSEWSADPAFQRIEVRERCAGFNEFASATMWDVQLRNAYAKDVDIYWLAEPETPRGAAQVQRALAVKPGEVVNTRHAGLQDCSGRLAVKVSEVQAAGTAVGNAAAPPPAPAAPPHVFVGRWSSKDPEPYRKELVFQVSGHTMTGAWSSPGLSFEITSPLPEGLLKGISIGPGEKKTPVPDEVESNPPKKLLQRQ